MGVRLVSLAEGDSVVAVARNAEASAQDAIDEGVGNATADTVVVVDGALDEIPEYTTEFAIEDDSTILDGNGQASS